MARQRNILIPQPEVLAAGLQRFAAASGTGAGAGLVIRMLKRLFWGFCAYMGLALIISPLHMLFGPVIGLPAAVVLMILMAVVAYALRQVRRQRAATVLGYVRQAVRLNQPINRTLTAAAAGENDRLFSRLMQLRMAIEMAAPLWMSLAYLFPEMPDRTIGMIHYAERVGRLPQTLDRLLRDHVAETANPRGNRVFARWYLPIGLILVCGLTWFISEFIFPEYRDILHDFKISVPPVTQWVNDCADFLTPVWLVMFAFLMILCGIQLRKIFSPRSRAKPVDRWLMDRILWMTPVIHRQQMDRAMADVCLMVADSLAMGRPLDAALGEAAQLQMNIIMQDRVRQWAVLVAAGNTPQEAARLAGIPAFAAGMLATGNAMENLEELFTFLGRYYGSRFDRRAEMMRGAIVPVATFFLATIVCIVALSVFLPLIELVQAIAGK